MTNFAIAVMTGHLISRPAGIQKTYTARDIVDSCPRLAHPTCLCWGRRAV